MMRLRNTVSGVVVAVRDGHPIATDSQWESADGKTAGAAEERSDTPDKSWTVADLKAYAAEHSIDLGKSTRKGDIVAVIAAAPAGDDDSDDESEDDSDDE